jgi:hypothetical protein
MTLVTDVHGGTANIATDYGTSPVGTTAHIPLSKLVWGDDTSSWKVNETTPLPIQITGVTGEAIAVTGFLGASGNFPIENKILGVTTPQYIAVGGDTSGGPVGVTGQVVVYDVHGNTGFIGITGTVDVTGGRYLNLNYDSVTVDGAVGISGPVGLAAGTDSISVFGHDQGRWVHTKIFSGSGSTIGASGDALNVNIVGAGLSANFTLSTTVGVTNPNSGIGITDALRIQGGISGCQPVVVQGFSRNAIEVYSHEPLGITLPVGINTELQRSGEAVKGLTTSVFTDGTQKVIIAENQRTNTIFSGVVQYTGGTSGLVMQLAAGGTLNSGVNLKANPGNIDIVYIGSSGLSGSLLDGYPLEPGENIFFETVNLNKLYSIGVTASAYKLNYIGS